MTALPWCLFAIAATACAACRTLPEPPARPGAPPLAIPVGANPVDLVAGDIDGDGDLDLVTADANDSALSVRLQRDGIWSAGNTVGIAFDPHMVSLADIDGDGDLDLVATGHDSGAVAVQRGDGSGRFTAAPGSPFTAFAVERPHNHGLAVGDLDGDGDGDVVAVDQEQQAAAVLLADGEGRLTPLGPPIAIGGEGYPPALGDVDRDDRLDLVIPLISTGEIAVMLGDGSGRFHHAPGSPHRTVKPRPYAITLVDLDRDGDPDVVAPHDDTDEISVLLGDGRGGLRPAPGSPVRAGLRIWRAAAADVDGDGNVDIVGAGSGSLIVLRGDGRGGLSLFWREPSDGWTAIAADLDGDNRPDLATADSPAGTVRVWLSGDRDPD